MGTATKWTPEQEFCIHDNGGTLLVSAAAGSGKTAVLVERIIKKITDETNPTDIDRLFVVTFTNAAAAEMKERIGKRLTQLVAESPEDRHLQRQLLALPRAAISTVDGFCANLLRENAYRLDISPQFKIAEEQQLSLLRSEALQEALDECYRLRDPNFLNLAASMSNGKNDRALMASVDRIFTFIQSHPYPDQWLTEMLSIYDSSLPIADTVWGKIVLEQVKESLRYSIALLTKAVSLCKPENKLDEKYQPYLLIDIHHFQEAFETLESGCGWDDSFGLVFQLKLSSLPTIRKEDSSQEKDRIAAIRKEITDQLNAIKKLYCGTEDQCRFDLQTTSRSVGALYDTVRVFSRIFTQKKRENNLLDFSDIEHLALQLLADQTEHGGSTPTPLAREIAARFDEIMVDEYQDTNALQDTLFSVLSRNEENLFFVGDVKQSIYGFRQAMPELFLKRRAQYTPYPQSGHPTTVSLSNNFRSRKTVTDSVNFLFRQLMTEQSGGIVYDEKEELVSSAKYGSCDGYETEFLFARSGEKSSTADRDAHEARCIAKRIFDCMENLTVTEGDNTRKAAYSDFCILLRNKKSHADTYRKELEKLGIPVSCDADNAFFDTAEIRLALSLLRCIDNPTLDVPLTAVLLSPLYGFTADDLAVIRLFHPQSCLYLAVCAARRHHDVRLATLCSSFVEQMNRYRNLSATMTVDALLRRLYEETFLPDLMSAQTNGEQRRENLEILYDRCCLFEDNGFRGLSAFIRFIDRLNEGGIPPSIKTASAAGNGVRIMSVHGSKGLEFPFVFLAGLSAQFNRDSSSGDLLLHPTLGAGMQLRDRETYNRYITLPYCGTSLQLRNDSRAEELRVLYVAVTRAREKLFLVMTENDLQKKLDLLSSTFEEDKPLHAYTLQTASSMSEWILAALIRHPSAEVLRHPLFTHPEEWEETDILPLPAETDCCIDLLPSVARIDATRKDDVTFEGDEALTDVLRERLNYRYPHTSLSETPAKVAASETAHGTVDLGFIATSRPAFLSKSGLTATERGTAMHDFMQYADYAAAENDIDEEIRRLVNNRFLSAEQADALDKNILSAFFKSDLYERMRRANGYLREFHFTAKQIPTENADTLPDGIFTIVQGIADCLIEENDGWVIVDYKTDSVKNDRQLVDRYRPQLQIYRQYLSPILDKPIKECLLYSFKLNRTIRVD